MSNTAPVEPVKDYFFVADHHADPDEVEEACRAQGVPQRQARVRGAAGGIDLDFHGGDRRRVRPAGVRRSQGPRRGRARDLHRHQRAPARHDAAGLPDVRAADPRRGHRGAAGRPARLPGAARVVRVPERGLCPPRDQGRGAHRAGGVRARRPPRRHRGDRQRPAAHRGDVDRDRGRGDPARHRGVGPRGQPPARRGPRADRLRDRPPARVRVPGAVRVQVRAPAAAPGGRRRVHSPQPERGAVVGARRQADARARPTPRWSTAAPARAR